MFVLYAIAILPNEHTVSDAVVEAGAGVEAADLDTGADVEAMNGIEFPFTLVIMVAS